MNSGFAFIASIGRSILRRSSIDEDTKALKEQRINAVTTQIKHIDRMELGTQSELWQEAQADLSSRIENFRLQLEQDDADSKTTKGILSELRNIQKWLPDLIAKRTELQDELNKLVDGND